MLQTQVPGNAVSDQQEPPPPGAAIAPSPRPLGESRLGLMLTLGLTIAGLYWLQDILLPVALAALLSFLLAPLVTKLERLGIGRAPAVIVGVAIAAVAVAGAGYLVTRQVIQLSEQLPEYKGSLIKRVRMLRGTTRSSLQQATDTLEDISEELASDQPALESSLNDAAEIEALRANAALATTIAPAAPTILVPEGISHGNAPIGASNGGSGDGASEPVAVQVVAMPPSPLKQLQTWLGPVIAPLTTGGLVVVLVIFILLQREDLRWRIVQLFGRVHLQLTTEALDDAARRVGKYLRMQAFINSCYGAALAGGLLLIGLPNAALWGILGGLLRFLPYVGPWVAAAMPLTVSLAVFDDWTHPLMAAGLFLVLELTVNLVLEPLLYGASTGVSSLGIIVSAIFWTWLWGPIGLILAMPLTVCLVVAGQYVPQLKFISILLGDRLTMPASERVYQRLLAMDDEDSHRLLTEWVSDHDRVQMCDDVLLPVLRMAEEDHHAGRLSDGQYQYVLQAVAESHEDLLESTSPEAADDSTEPEEMAVSDDAPRKRMLCVAVRDDADELAGDMLARLLADQGIAMEVVSSRLTAGELLERLESEPVDAVVLSMMPPLGVRDGRYLLKRLRAKFPNLLILVGIWTGTPESQVTRRMQRAGASRVIHSLAELLEANGGRDDDA